MSDCRAVVSASYALLRDGQRDGLAVVEGLLKPYPARREKDVSMEINESISARRLLALSRSAKERRADDFERSVNNVSE